jgi:hypothetical protein
VLMWTVRATTLIFLAKKAVAHLVTSAGEIYVLQIVCLKNFSNM